MRIPEPPAGHAGCSAGVGKKSGCTNEKALPEEENAFRRSILNPRRTREKYSHCCAGAPKAPLVSADVNAAFASAAVSSGLFSADWSAGLCSAD